MSGAALELGDSVLVAKRPQNAAGRVSENSRLFVVSSPPRDYADHEEDNCDDDHDKEDNCDDVDDDKADVSVSMAEFSRKITNVCLSLSPQCQITIYFRLPGIYCSAVYMFASLSPHTMPDHNTAHQLPVVYTNM